MKALGKRLEIEKHVKWPGFVQYKDLPVYYGLASAFVHPAKEEAWGLVLNEAAASGLPILAGSAVGARFELLEEGTNGHTFDAYSDTDIAVTLEKTSRLSQDRLSDMGEASRRIVAAWGTARFGSGLREALRKTGVIASTDKAVTEI